MGKPGANANDFTPTNNCPAALAPSSTCTVDVTLKASIAAAESATLQVSETDPSSPQNVSLSGTGLNACLSVAPSSLSFGPVAVGGTSGPMAFDLTNNCSASVIVTNISVGMPGANAADFLLTPVGGSPACQTTIPGLGPCGQAVMFKPSAAAAESATVTINDNVDSAALTVALSGTGTSGGNFVISVVSALPATPGQPNIATVSAGKSATYTLQLASTGGFACPTINLSAAPPAGMSFPPGSGPGLITPNPAMLAAGGTTNFSFGFITTALTPSSPISPPGSPLGWMVLWAMMAALFSAALLLGCRKTAPRFATYAIAMTLVVAMLISGCLGNSRIPTPAGDYIIDVSASGCGITHGAVVQLIVQ